MYFVTLAVPVFDGREAFQIGNYWERPYPGEVAEGSTVMTLFSIRKSELSQAMKKVPNLPEDVKFSIYLNILGVIVLEEAVDHFSEQPSEESPEAFGVDKTMEYVGSQETDEVVGTGDVESGIEELEESFL